MPFELMSNYAGGLDNSTLVTTAAVAGLAYGFKVYTGGRKNIWEREWTGKLIMIVAPPTPTTLALMDHLLRLPSPPTVLYLPPLPSPLPESLLTVLHTMRLGIANTQHGALHCEALPPTPKGVRHFVRKWAGAPMGTVGEGGRRVDAIVLGGAWECRPENPIIPTDPAEDPEWTPAEFHFHLITALLPSLLRAPPERDIRIIQLVSPAWTAALPGIEAGLEGKQLPPAAVQVGLTADAAKRGTTSLLLLTHLKLVLDTLASAAYGQAQAAAAAVPDPSDPAPATAAAAKKKRDESVQSNILALAVVMPWARDEVVWPVWGTGSIVNFITYLMLLPFIWLLTPSPSRAVQGVLHALSAPVKFPGEVDADPKRATAMAVPATEGGDSTANMVAQQQDKQKRDADTVTDPRKNGVRQGDVVRDCAVIDIPPVLCDPLLARATYEKIEGEVEKGVRASETREKAFAAKEEQNKSKGAAAAASAEKPATEPATAAK